MSRESFPEGGCATDMATPAVPTASNRKRFHLEKGVIHMFIVKDKELVIIIAFKFKI